MLAGVERRVDSGREREVEEEGAECVRLELVMVMGMLSLIALLVVLVLVRRVGRGDELGDGVCGGGAMLLLGVSCPVVCVVGWMEECTGIIPSKLVVVVGFVLSNWNSR